MDTAEYLVQLGRKPDNIRNFCMVAHVDHGKTTLSDYLLASNGVLSNQLAGTVRFLDSREDEQEREITMKASSVALRHECDSESYLLHLVDSPGHIDFSSEVSTAIRVSDGAIIVVDLVDCVTTQTMSMLRQVFAEGLSMVLVVNKIDLIITTMQLSAEETYVRLRTIIETCNATLAAFTNQLEISGERPDLLQNIPEDHVWFSPSRGNVVFASCLDGWGFSLDHFSSLFSAKFGVPITTKDLWGNHFFDARSKKISETPKRDDHPTMAVQMVLNPLWQLHEAFLSSNFDESQCVTMSEKLGINQAVWNKPRLNPRAKLSALLKNWMPLATAVLNMVCRHCNSPVQSQQLRLPRLIGSLETLNDNLRNSLMACSPADDAPTVAFISKLLDTESLAGQTIGQLKEEFDIESNFVGFTRIFCGKVRRGQVVRVQTIGGDTECTIKKVFLLRGRGLEEVESVSAGCLCGIGGITSQITKYATVSTDFTMPAMEPPRLSSTSIVRLAVSPKDPTQLPQLVKGLQLLYKIDPQVEIFMLPTGEHVIGGAGEVHAERCVKDLHDCFARIEMTVSEPLVPIRETILTTGKPKVAIQTTLLGHLTFSVSARSLPEEAAKLLCDESQNMPTPHFLSRILKEIANSSEKRKWADVGECWGWGPQKLGYCGALLFCALKEDDPALPLVRQHRDAILAGFQLACGSGPMADEPLTALAFVISEVSTDPEAPEGVSVSLSGQIMSTMKDVCRKAVEIQPRRLVEPVFDCTVYSSGLTQGKIYALLGKRRAIIIDEVMNEGSDLYYISCHLPALESFGLQDELRVATAGAATAQLRMSHWAMIEQDPYYKPTTREELEEDGAVVIQNFAAQTLERIRRRKGLHREVVVESAEKQRFSTKS